MFALLTLASTGFATLRDPLPDPCASGFHPSCEQARGFGLCGKMGDVVALCKDACAYEGNT